MQHARVAATVTGLVVVIIAVLPRLGSVGDELAVGIATPYGDVAAMLGIALAIVSGTGDVRGWRGGVVLTLGFGAMATTFPVLADVLAGTAEAEVFVFLTGGAVAIAAGAYGAGVARARREPEPARSVATETSSP